MAKKMTNLGDLSGLSREEILAALAQLQAQTGGSFTNQQLTLKKQLESALRRAVPATEMPDEKADRIVQEAKQKEEREALVAKNQQALDDDKLLRSQGINPANIPDAEEGAKAEIIRKEQEKQKEKERQDAERRVSGQQSSNPLIGGISNVQALAEAEAMFGEMGEPPPRERYRDMFAGETYNPKGDGDILISDADGTNVTRRRREINPDYVEWQAKRAQMIDQAKNQMAQGLIGNSLLGIGPGGKMDKPSLSEVDYGIDADNERRAARQEFNAAVNDPENPVTPEDRQQLETKFIGDAAAADRKLQGLRKVNPAALPGTERLIGSNPDATRSWLDVFNEAQQKYGFNEEQAQTLSGSTLIGEQDF